ncbi:MAG: hypothetical protein R3F54_21660 [Alphaproteobacteria bacterium]
MTRSIGLAVLAVGLLAGCAQIDRALPDAIRSGLPTGSANADADIVPMSLRPVAETTVAALPEFVDDPDVSLRLRNEYARLQVRWPLLPRDMPMRLTAIARSYVAPDAFGAPRAKIMLRLSLPLPFAPQAQGSTGHAPSGAEAAAPSASLIDDAWQQDGMARSGWLGAGEPIGEALDGVFLPVPAADQE